jgi:hypothetical protein
MKQLKVSINSHSIAGTKPENQDACAYHIYYIMQQDYLLSSLSITDTIQYNNFIYYLVYLSQILYNTTSFTLVVFYSLCDR